MYHGNDDGLKALDIAEQKIKEARVWAMSESRSDLLPGLTLAMTLLLDAADDVAPAGI